MSSTTQTVNGAELLKGNIVDAYTKYHQPTLSAITDWTMAGTIITDELLKSGKGPATEVWSNSQPYDPNNWNNSLTFSGDKGSKLNTTSTTAYSNNNGYAVTNFKFDLNSDSTNKNPSYNSPIFGLNARSETINRVDTDSNGKITLRSFSSSNDFVFNKVLELSNAQTPSTININANLSRQNTVTATSYNGVNSYNSQSRIQEGYTKDGYLLNASVFTWEMGSFDGVLDLDPNTIVLKHKVSWSTIQQYGFLDQKNGFGVSFVGAGYSNQDENITSTNLRQILWNDAKAGVQIAKLDGAVTISSAFTDKLPEMGLQGSDDLTKVKGVLTDLFFKTIIDSSVVVTATNMNGSVMSGGKGNDIFHGDVGFDTVIFSGKKSDYNITKDTGFIKVSDSNATRDGADTLFSVEKIKFSDISIDYSADDTTAQVYRVYKAVLGRPGDEGGLGYWTYLLDNGLKLKDMVNSFFGSQEFRTNFNANENKAFVDLVYKNVLGRAPEQSGSDYWVGELNKGLDRADLLTGFSESNEFKTKIVGEIQSGISYLEYHHG